MDLDASGVGVVREHRLPYLVHLAGPVAGTEFVIEFLDPGVDTLFLHLRLKAMKHTRGLFLFGAPPSTCVPGCARGVEPGGRRSLPTESPSRISPKDGKSLSRVKVASIVKTDDG